MILSIHVIVFGVAVLCPILLTNSSGPCMEGVNQWSEH